VKRKPDPHIQQYKQLHKVRRWRKEGHPYLAKAALSPEGFLLTRVRPTRADVQSYFVDQSDFYGEMAKTVAGFKQAMEVIASAYHFPVSRMFGRLKA
jgi:hypothetical protein